MAIKVVLASLCTEMFSLCRNGYLKQKVVLTFQASPSHSPAHNHSMSLSQKHVSRVLTPPLQSLMLP